jgi:hypothetical protein
MNTPVSLEAAGRGRAGWAPLDTANIYYDHPFHLARDHSLNIDLTRAGAGPEERIALELSGASAAALAHAILEALAAGEHMTGDDHTREGRAGAAVA